MVETTPPPGPKSSAARYEHRLRELSRRVSNVEVTRRVTPLSLWPQGEERSLNIGAVTADWEFRKRIDIPAGDFDALYVSMTIFGGDGPVSQLRLAHRDGRFDPIDTTTVIDVDPATTVWSFAWSRPGGDPWIAGGNGLLANDGFEDVGVPSNWLRTINIETFDELGSVAVGGTVEAIIWFRSANFPEIAADELGNPQQGVYNVGS